MKVQFLMFLCCFNMLLLTAQESINQVNESGAREGIWKKEYPNGRIRYQGQFKNGKEIGVFKYYSIRSSKHPILIKTFSKENNLAEVVFYTENGVIESKGVMDGKNRVGQWLYYHKDGVTILSEENYENGVLNGVSKTFYKTGKPTEILYYKNGKLHGNMQRFADNGVLIDDVNYVDGKLNGLAKFYNLKGELIYTGMYKNDEKIGKWEYFNEEETKDKSILKQ
ncbi:toxin-antitoxin system YwqK family antitoxin [Lutibacter holmesii]|uniref:Toxin-antitoxin system YwqK family antitoxin n=1 Tax=Lutibacter holmesii TaxID=1137985 RepID=A0ABW3WKA2_9FLAO